MLLCLSNYEKIPNIRVDGNIYCVPHLLLQRATVYGFHIRVSEKGNTTLSINILSHKTKLIFRLKYFPSVVVDVGGGENPLDGCTFVYLDMGTNIGVQIR